MKAQVSHWFPTLISYEILENLKKDNQYLEEKARLIQATVNGNVKTNWRSDTFNTIGLYSPVKDNDQKINNFIKEITRKVYEFSQNFGVKRSIESLECTDFWFNIAGVGSYQELHQHTDCHFSAVYYVRTNPSCGNIIFQSTESITDMMPLPIDINNVEFASCKNCFYEPLDSVLLIFRSNLLHMVEKNLSGRDRISIAMNFKFNKEVF